MKYQYKVKVTPLDFFRLSMHRTYHSLAGVCNIVFTAAMLLLTARFWNQTNDVLEAVMVLGCLVFPVFQPFVIYMRAKAQVAAIPPDLELSADDKGIHISVGERKEDIRWSKVKSVMKEYKMVIILSDASHGYILTDRVLGKEKEAFYEFVKSEIDCKK